MRCTSGEPGQGISAPLLTAAFGVPVARAGRKSSLALGGTGPRLAGSELTKRAELGRWGGRALLAWPGGREAGAAESGLCAQRTGWFCGAWSRLTSSGLEMVQVCVFSGSVCPLIWQAPL